MQHKNNLNQIDDDYIDFQDVLSSIFNFIKNLGRKFSAILNVLKHRFGLILLISVLGALSGFAAYEFTKPYYTSSMTLVLAEIRNQFVEDQLDKLSDMVEEDNFAAIAERLDISEVKAKQIKKLTFSNLDQDRVSEDSVLTGSPFRIELQLYDNNLFDEMEPAITDYLENNRFFAKQKRIKQRQIEGMISKLKNEISSIDSVKTTSASPRGPVNGFVYGEALDPSNLYRESISMYRQQAELEAELEQLDNMQVVIGFSPQSKPTGPNLILFLLVGAFLAFLIGLLIALRLEARSNRKLAL